MNLDTSAIVRRPALVSLERFARRARRVREAQRCELCGAPIGEVHRHVVDSAERHILCACVPCALTFAGHKGRFCAAPDRVLARAMSASDATALRTLGVPVGLAFFFRSSSLGRWVGVFPSPAGPTEAELPDGAEESALFRSVEDDVEALLVRCDREGAVTALLVPIDVCYELVALVRRVWRGIDGGDEGRRELDRFFERLARRSEREAELAPARCGQADGAVS